MLERFKVILKLQQYRWRNLDKKVQMKPLQCRIIVRKIFYTITDSAIPGIINDRKYLRIRYEDLASSPIKWAKYIYRYVHIDTLSILRCNETQFKRRSFMTNTHLF